VTIATDIHDSFSLLLETPPPEPQGIRLSIAGEVVDFIADTPSGIHLAEAILGPYCKTSRLPAENNGAEDHRWTVVSIAQHRVSGLAADLYAALGRSAPARQVRRWPTDFDSDRFDVGDARSVVMHRMPFTGLTLFSRAARRILYLRADDAYDVSHTEHCIKYPFRCELRRSGFSQVHASGCVLNSRGILITGEKGRGKSTLVIHAMTRGATEVSNDLGYIRHTADGGYEMIAVPQITRLGPGTVADNELIRTALAAEPRTGDYLKSPVFNNEKEEFYYPVLRRIWGREPVCQHASLDLIIFPMLDVNLSRNSSATFVPPEEARERLLTCMLHDSPLPEWLPFFEPEELSDVTAAAAANFLRGTPPPAFELHFGGSSTDPVSAIENILQEIHPQE
jgi:hypothetical protein